MSLKRPFQKKLRKNSKNQGKSDSKETLNNKHDNINQVFIELK